MQFIRCYICSMSDESVSLYPIFTRVCLRCQRAINGYGFYTLYGYIVVGENGAQKKIHGCGDAVHHRCPSDATTRVVPHDSGIEGISEYTRHMRNVAPGVDYNARTGRYAARVDKKRLGTHLTQELAEQAIKRFLNQRERRKEKRNASTSQATREHAERAP